MDIESIFRDPDWTDEIAGYRIKISDAQAQEIINAHVDGPHEYDGRSGWYLVRTTDGSLMLACYPHGDTYFATESYRGSL